MSEELLSLGLFTSLPMVLSHMLLMIYEEELAVVWLT